MDFNYGTGFGVVSAPAYERLIGDAMRGDATLFTRWDAVAASLGAGHADPRAAGQATADESFPNYPGRHARPGILRSDARSRGRGMEEDMTPPALPAAEIDSIRAELARAKPHTTTMNFIVWIDREQNRDWVIQRAIRISEKHPSRTIVLDSSPGRTGAHVRPLDPNDPAQKSTFIDIGVRGRRTRGCVRDRNFAGRARPADRALLERRIARQRHRLSLLLQRRRTTDRGRRLVARRPRRRNDPRTRAVLQRKSGRFACAIWRGCVCTCGKTSSPISSTIPR